MLLKVQDDPSKAAARRRLFTKFIGSSHIEAIHAGLTVLCAGLEREQLPDLFDLAKRTAGAIDANGGLASIETRRHFASVAVAAMQDAYQDADDAAFEQAEGILVGNG